MGAAKEVCSIVESNSVLVNGLSLISYSAFSHSRQTCREKYGDLYDQCFWPRVFLSFPFIEEATEDGFMQTYIETRCLNAYIHEFGRIMQTKKELTVISKNGQLNAEQIIGFVNRKLKPVYALKAKNRERLNAACQLAAFKFKFYHEKNGYCQVDDVTTGITAWELERALKSFNSVDLENHDRCSNWFSDRVMFDILDVFVTAADGVDGYVTHVQFCSLPSFSTFSPSFIQYLFLQLEKKGPEDKRVMDLSDYAKWMLAWNDRNSAAAVRYLFGVFDSECKGFLMPQDILFFLQETVGLLSIGDPESAYEDMAGDILIEILDMVGPVNKEAITAMDMIKCKNGYEVFGMMADASELYRHEHRDD